MNIKGTVVAVLAPQSGEGKNGTWIKRSYVIEMPGEFPKKVSVSIWGDKFPILKDGESVDCSVEVESKEYNGKWYTEVKCWKVDIISKVATPATKVRTKKVEADDNDFSSFEAKPDDDATLPF